VPLPVSRQQHGDVWTEVLVDLENENDEDKMTIENDFPCTCFPLDFLQFDNVRMYEFIFDSRILFLGFFSDKSIEFLCKLKN